MLLIRLKGKNKGQKKETNKANKITIYKREILNEQNLTKRNTIVKKFASGVFTQAPP